MVRGISTTFAFVGGVVVLAVFLLEGMELLADLIILTTY